jgi:hypothetical protein
MHEVRSAHLVLGLLASAIDIFIETAGVAGFEIGDDEARVDAVGPCFGSRDDALDAEDEVEAIGAAEVDCLGRAIMAVGAQQAAQEALGLLPAGALCRPQHGGDEAAGAVEHDDRLKTIFVMMRVEKAELLATELSRLACRDVGENAPDIVAAARTPPSSNSQARAVGA